MPRYAKSGTTKEKLTEAIMKFYDEEEYDDDEDADDEEKFEYALKNALYSKVVRKDLSKIEFDFENITVKTDEFDMRGFVAGFDTVHDFAILWVGAGGDWEQPLAFCLYLDNKNKLRGYIPTNGNFFDVEHKAAWGNYDDKYDNIDNDPIRFNMNLMWNDVADRIQPAV